MSKVLRIVCLLAVLMLVAYVGCSGNGGNVVAPCDPADIRDLTADGHVTCLWGMWEVTIRKSTGEVSIIKLREADLALNVLGFMEPPVLVNMSIDFGTLDLEPENNYIGVNVILKHPIPDAVFKGFDVRGIVFGADVTNADGYTRWYNPDEFTGTPFGYIDGLLGTPDSYGNFNEHFNGYKYFADNINLSESVSDFFADSDHVAARGLFSEGETNRRHYDLQFGGDFSDFMIFNYAVAASYNWPSGEPPFDLDDFDITTCNQAEPVFIKVSELNNTLWNDGTSGGGNLDLAITVFDWVKPITPETVMVDGGAAFAETAAVFDSDLDVNKRLYTLSIAAAPVTSADLDLTLTVKTEKTYGENFFLELMPASHPLYSEGIETIVKHTVTVSDAPLSNLCEGKLGIPVFGIDEYIDPALDGWYEDMCTMSDNRFIVHDNSDEPLANTSGDLLAVTYNPMPPIWDGWEYIHLTGFNMNDILIQIESDSNDNIITAYEGDDSFDVWDYDGATNSVSHVTTVSLVVDDIAAMCVDGDDNLWVLTLNMEMHKFDAGTYNHDTSATFDVSANVHGWVWDFVNDPFDGKFYILHEDDGTGLVNDGVLSKYSADGIYEEQLVGVFPYPIADFQAEMEADPGEADIIIDMSDPSESSCRIICVADYDDGYSLTQVARIRAYDLGYIGTPGYDIDSWGCACATMSKSIGTTPELLFVGESDWSGYIDAFIIQPGGVW